MTERESSLELEFALTLSRLGGALGLSGTTDNVALKMGTVGAS